MTTLQNGTGKIEKREESNKRGNFGTSCVEKGGEEEE